MRSREGQRFGHVVRHEDHALGDARLNAPELLLQLTPRDWIERTERFVHQQHRRIDGERPSDADALTLAPGEFVGQRAVYRLWCQADQLEQFAHAGGDAIIGPLLQPRHHGDVVGDGEMRKQANVLNDVADRSTQANRIPLTRVDALDAYLTGVGHQQPSPASAPSSYRRRSRRRARTSCRRPTVSEKSSRMVPAAERGRTRARNSTPSMA